MSGGKQRTTIQSAKERLFALSDSLAGQPHFTFPTFDQLPRIEGQPQGCAWGLFDKNGVKDELGTLNLLTPEVVQQASKEIQTGQHVQLDWNLSDNVQFPGFGRRKLAHKILDARAASHGKHAGFDDELHLNTQSGSQWDSLKHFAHQPTQMYYNGLSHDAALANPAANGIHTWCEAGGIVARGVLVDWLRWHEHTHASPAPSPISRHEIPVAEIDACLHWQGTTPRVGDILLIRSGYTKWHDDASPAARRAGTQQNSRAIGLQSNEATVRWLYDRHFSAVAGDTLAFEAWPPPLLETGWTLHEWLLVQWGTPIGELWNLEQLAAICAAQGRWTFFLTSAPLNVRGGVGSPPGAIAVF